MSSGKKSSQHGRIGGIFLVILAIVIAGVLVLLLYGILDLRRQMQEELRKQAEEPTEVTMYVTDDTYLLEEPNEDAQELKRLNYQQAVSVTDSVNDFYEVDLDKIGIGYVRKKYLTETAPKLVDPKERHWSYQREGLKIEIQRYDKKELVYWVADIETDDPENDIRTAMSGGSYQKSFSVYRRTSDMAKEQGAVFAVNGDEFGFRGKKSEYRNPLVIRNGRLYYEDTRDIGEMCALYKDGTLKIFRPGDLGNGSDMMKAGVKDVWWFDCALVKNGEIPQSLIEVEESLETAPYTAIGQKDRNHFIFIVVDGRGSNGSEGVTYTGMARLMKKYGAVTAYQLDGGGSSTIWFDGMVLNEPSDGTERKISDIIYVR